MTLAEQKLKQNVAEYILFMWQMEDLVRAVYFDSEAIDDFIRTYTPDDQAFDSEKKWFEILISTMRNERVEQKGHITEVHELMFELGYLHNTLVNVIKETTYLDLYRKAQPYIKEYLPHTDGKTTNDVETCLVALYGLLLLRLRKEVVSDATREAMQTFSDLLARLSHHFGLMKKGEMNFALN
ncbi:MAG: DUF4924 family protein [Flavobacteriales bacterium]